MELEVTYGGDGASTNVCRADHTHAGSRWDVYDQSVGLMIQAHCTANDATCTETVLDGENLATAGTGVGLYGRTFASQGYGVRGENWATSGKATGLLGLSTKSPDGIGVTGIGGGTTTGSPSGVLGAVTAPLGLGVQGVNYAATGGVGKIRPAGCPATPRGLRECDRHRR